MNKEKSNDRLLETYARIDGARDASTSYAISDDIGSETKKKKIVVVNSEFEDVPNSAIRKVIASRLLASKRAQPHVARATPHGISNTSRERPPWPRTS